MPKKNDMDKSLANILEIRDFSVSFNNEEGRLFAVDRIDYDLKRGKTLGIVGESGSGKTVNVMAMMGLINGSRMDVKGQARFNGLDLLSAKRKVVNSLRGREIGFVFQNPLSCLNPVMRIGKQISEGAVFHGIIDKKDATDYSIDLLRKVGIRDADKRYRDYPHQFSGGMRQRVMIAMAMSCQPSLLICDEPTTSLDVTVEKQILELLQQMKEENNLSIIMITHNLSLAMNFCDDLAVMFGGHILERGSVLQIAKNPLHPYTRGLFGANLEVGKKGQPIGTIREEGGELADLPDGCVFVPNGYEGEMPLTNLEEVPDEPNHWVNSLFRGGH